MQKERLLKICETWYFTKDADALNLLNDLNAFKIYYYYYYVIYVINICRFGFQLLKVT